MNGSLDNYVRLVEVIDRERGTSGWGLAKILLEVHGRKLAMIRAGSATRLIMILRIYVYLREAAKQRFFTQAVHTKVLRSSHGTADGTQSTGNRGEGGRSTNASTSSLPTVKCSHCNRIHRGGHIQSDCPFKDLEPALAKTTAAGVSGPTTSWAWVRRAKAAARAQRESADTP